jgi:hypothetical protein
VVGAETGFVLKRNPDTVRAPDAAFIAAVRVPAGGLPETYFDGAPDAVADQAQQLSAREAGFRFPAQL